MRFSLNWWQTLLTLVVALGGLLTGAVTYVDNRYAKAEELQLVADTGNKRYEEYLRSLQADVNNQKQQWIDRQGPGAKMPRFITREQQKIDHKKCVYERDVLGIKKPCVEP